MFWGVIFILFVCVGAILNIICTNNYPIDNSATYNDAIFSNGLNFIFGILGFLVALIVLLIQHLTQNTTQN